MDEQRLVDRFMRMVSIPSESGQEQEFIAWLQNVLLDEFEAECGLDGYGNLIAKLSAKDSSRADPVLFGVHADTVSPGTNIRPQLEDGVIRSGGDTVLGADDKAGIAELLEALAVAKRRPPLEIVVTREEERGLAGAKNLDFSRLAAKSGFLLDMDAIDAVVVGGPSRMTIDVQITGRAAHAGMEPEKGISAIRAAALAITKLREGWVDEDTTVNVGVMAAGENRNGVPERAIVRAECRSRRHTRCLAESERLKEVFEMAAREAGAAVRVDMELAYKAIQIPEDAPVVSVARRAVEAVGLTPKVQVICGGTDASVYNDRGIQTVVVGMGARDEHSTREHIRVEDMKQAVRMLTFILEELS